MSADTTSVFYQVGQAVKAEISSGNQGILNTAQTWQGTQTFADVIIATGKTITLTDHTDHGVLYSDVDGVLSTKAGFEYDASSDTLTVSNLSVTGVTTSVQTTNLEVKDNFIHVSKGANAGAYDKDSGLYFERAQGSDAQAFIWDESEDRFVLGQLSGGGSTKTVTFSGVSAQVGTAAAGATVGVSISGNLNYSNSGQYGSPGTVTTPDKFYLLPTVDGQTVQVGSGSEQLSQDIKDMGSGFYIIATMDLSGGGDMLSGYSVVVYVAPGDTFADVTTLHLWDGAAGAFFNDQGEMYNATSFASGETFDFGGAAATPLTHTNGYYSSGTGIFTFSISDTSASLGASANTDISTGAYPKTASIESSGSVTYAAGTYDVTFTLKGQLASDITDFQISGTDGGSPVTDYNGFITPFAYNSGTLSYISDSASPYTTFQQLAVDASKLQYSSSNTGFNGGYFLANSTDGTQLEVSFDATPGENDYIGLAHGSSVVMPVPATGSADGPDADTATVTPGPLTVGELKLDQQNLGDYADFTAGLNA